jgi:copper transport protein
MRVVARPLGRGLVVLVLASTALGVLAPVASAHAFLVRSDPPAGATLPSGPGVVRLWFSEEVSQALGSARLVDGDGRTVAGVRLPASSDSRSLAIELPSLSTGSYGVLWRLLDEDDGHTTSGVLVFHVGAADRVAAFETRGASPTDPPLDVALHWLAFCALAGVIGALGVGVFVIGRAERRDPSVLFRGALHAAKRRLMVFGAVCAAAGALVGLGSLIAVAERLAQPGSGRSLASTVETLLVTRWGILWVFREIALVALAAALVSVVTPRPWPRAAARSPLRAIVGGVAIATLLVARWGIPWIVLEIGVVALAAGLAMILIRRPVPPPALRRSLPAIAGGLALAAVITQALGSHAATLDSGRLTAVAADALHLLTALLWLGSLPALLLLLWPKPQGIGRSVLVRACRTPFSWLAGTSVCLVVATGLYSAGRQVETAGGIASTSYGRTLVVKSLIVVAVGALGLVNAARLHGWRPRRLAGSSAGGRSPSLWLITVESGVGIVVLLVASALIGTQPARGPVPALPSGAPATRTVYGWVDDLVVSVSVTPNRPGVNGFTLLAASSRRPPPAPVESVELELERGGRTGVVALKEIEAGKYFGTGMLDEAGRWELTAIIRRAERRLVARVALRIPESTVSPVLARPAGLPLAPIVDVLAVLVLAGGVLVAFTARRRAGRAGTDRNRRPEVDAPPDGVVLDDLSGEADQEDEAVHALAGSRERGP